MNTLSSLRNKVGYVNDLKRLRSFLAQNWVRIPVLSVFTCLVLSFNFGFSGSPDSNPEANLTPESGGVLVSAVTIPNVTARFANPQYDCVSEEYCLDVEFQSDIANTEIFTVANRFFYDDPLLEYINFRNFQGGYGPSAPNPATNNYISAGPALFNFSGGADFIQGGVQKTSINAPPIYLSTSGWTKLYQVCFTVDNNNGNPNIYCPPAVWDLKSDPSQGGMSGSAGIVITLIDNGNGTNALEHVEQFNWQYIGNGSPPYGEPVENTCISINCGTCDLTVTSVLNEGPGTLRDIINCASSGDTIIFGSSLAGATISITTDRLLLNKDLYIRSNLTPHVKIISSIPGLFDVFAGKTVEIKDLDITSGTMVTGNDGAAFKNEGILRLIGVRVLKNSSLPNGQYLIRNKPGSQFFTFGNCYIEIP